MTLQGNVPSGSKDDPSFKFQVRLYTFRVTPYDVAIETIEEEVEAAEPEPVEVEETVTEVV